MPQRIDPWQTKKALRIEKYVLGALVFLISVLSIVVAV